MITGTVASMSTSLSALSPLLLKNTDVEFSTYDCKATNDDFLTIPDGVNNLGSIGWGTRIRGLKCRNFQPDMS
jgi:hypothetical protein